MGDVDDLTRLFPVVDRFTIKQVYERLDTPTSENVAAALDRLAGSGKLPEYDYRGMLESNQRQYREDEAGTIELDVDDPLDVPPDADPTSEENARRGQRAVQWANEHAIDNRAEEVATNGTLEEMVELINTVDRWANEALLSPKVSGIGDTQFKRALNVLSDGFRGILDEYAATGDVEALREARSTVDGVRNTELRTGLKREARGYERLVTGSGRDFERAKAWALDEGLTPWRLLKRVDNARYEFDITYEQQERLEALAREWLEEYRELQAEV